ncbi:hypothetical protein BS297_07275 [Rhodococcus erythropolis]|uniref:Cutinase n=1 Tax=Rhodococcus erythropolis TaxID=1833 RepID=A0A5N5E6V8_RHOER|nr:hypothetical protein BS297_07275 [Rhodococcus erythropolis]
MSTFVTARRVTVAAVAIGVLAAVVAVPAATANQSAPKPACPDNLLLAIPGTTETTADADPTQSRGMLKNVTDPLANEFSAAQLQVEYVPYMALIVDDKADTYGTSKKQAIDTASKMIADKAAECTNTKFGLTGFSQGADAAGDLAADIGSGSGPVDRNRMFGVALLADPGQSKNAGKSIGAPITGVGFAGARPAGFGELSDIAVSVCAAGDLYCNTPDDAVGTQFIGALGSQIDARDPVKSVAGVVTTLLGLNGAPLTKTLDALNQNVATGNFLAVPQLALDLASQVGNLSADVAAKTIPGADMAPVTASVTQLTDTVARGDFLAVPALLAQLAPQVINFATQLSTVIGQVVSKLPINEYAAIGVTVSRISANAAMQNYIALPPDLGKLVGQLNNAVRKTLKALPLDAFPMLNKVADELTPGKVLDEVLNYATFIANDDHNSYASTPINDSGRTGAEELTNNLRTQINNGGAAVTA